MRGDAGSRTAVFVTPTAGPEPTFRQTATAVAPSPSLRTATTPPRRDCATTASSPADKLFCVDPATLQPARVIRIVDGDTLHVELDGSDVRVRLYGVDTPELGTPCADEATSRLRELAAGDVRMRADARERDAYGRLLRYLYTADGLSIDAEMVEEGLARAWRKDGALREGIIMLELEATNARRGCLWQ